MCAHSRIPMDVMVWGWGQDVRYSLVAHALERLLQQSAQANVERLQAILTDLVLLSPRSGRVQGGGAVRKDGTLTGRRLSGQYFHQ